MWRKRMGFWFLLVCFQRRVVWKSLQEDLLQRHSCHQEDTCQQKISYPVRNCPEVQPLTHHRMSGFTDKFNTPTELCKITAPEFTIFSIYFCVQTINCFFGFLFFFKENAAMKVAESEIRRGALSSPSPWGGGEAWAFPHHHALPPTCLGEPCWQPRWYSMATMTTGTMGELGTRAGYIRVRKMLCQKEPPSPGSWATTSPNNVAPTEVPGILQGHQLLSQGHWPRNGVVDPWSLSWSAGQGWLHLLAQSHPPQLQPHPWGIF